MKTYSLDLVENHMHALHTEIAIYWATHLCVMKVWSKCENMKSNPFQGIDTFTLIFLQNDVQIMKKLTDHFSFFMETHVSLQHHLAENHHPFPGHCPQISLLKRTFNTSSPKEALKNLEKGSPYGIGRPENNQRTEPFLLFEALTSSSLQLAIHVLDKIT